MAQPKSGIRKAPGLMSFVVWRQFFMVLGAPGIATALLPMFGAETNFIVVLVISAVPALVHGQLWKWTYDWQKKGANTLRKLRIGQVVLGLVHLGLSGWALSQVATGAISWEGSGFYFGLTIAGALGGLWETIRPGMELQNPPESHEPAATKPAAPEPSASTTSAASDAPAPPQADPSSSDHDAAPSASAAFGDGTHSEDAERSPSNVDEAVTVNSEAEGASSEDPEDPRTA